MLNARKCMWEMETQGDVPSRYRVSNFEGYKQGSAWLRMKTTWAMVYNTNRELAKGSILQARA
jgi:hypothetical protein